jgi:hypothetical protein
MHWQTVDMSGLGNYVIKHIAMGEGQVVLGRPLSRLYAGSEDDLFYSSSSGRWWDSIKGRDRTLVLPYLTNIYLSLNDTLPPNYIRTYGTRNSDGSDMTLSPIGLAPNTHVWVPQTSPFAVPTGMYFERYFNAHDEFEVRLVSQATHLPGQQMAQLTQVQTLTSVSAGEAAQGVVQVMQRWLRANSVPKTLITIESSFATPNSRLRSLRPTHRVSLVGSIAISDLSSGGVPVSTEVLNFSGSEVLYVLSHAMKKGPANTVTTTTVLSPVLVETPLTPADLSLAQSESIRNIRVFR